MAVAIVDYGMGNLFSVQRACQCVGIEALITSDPEEVAGSSGVILPGVGAFGNAIATLRATGLADAIVRSAGTGKPLLGICLGMQLFMQESSEFGIYQGLGLIEGSVLHLGDPGQDGVSLKVPHVQWSRVNKLTMRENWDSTILDGMNEGVYMYFVHSFRAVPVQEEDVLAETTYGDVRFCSAIQKKNIMAVQFHPERSGVDGLKVYSNFKRVLDSGGVRV